MSRIILDASVSNQLDNLSQMVDLCDPSGRVLGQFVPVFDPSEWEVVGPELSEEELNRREQSEESYSTLEVLAHLKSLEAS